MELEHKSQLLDKWKEDIKKYPNMIVRTSGSTSKPLLICLNDIDIENITNIGARCFKTAGVGRGMVVINTLSSSCWCGGTVDSVSIYKAGATLINYSVGNTKELVGLIMKLTSVDGVKVALSGTPSYLDRIEQVAKAEYGINANQVGISLILAGGEAGVQNPNFRKRIQDKWKAKLIDANYGQADSVSMFASEDCITQDGLIYQGGDEMTAKLLIDNELVDPEEDKVGQLVVSTNWIGGLVNRKNYCTGDMIKVGKVKGKNFHFTILGRADDMLVIRGLNVYPSTIVDVFQKLLMEYGLDGKIQIHVSAVDPIDEVRINTDVDNEEFLNAMKVEVKNATSIRCDVINGPIIEGSTGKTKLVIKDL